VTREKVTELLALQSEHDILDYKTECDLNDPVAVMEIAKDIGAMMILGGYLVIGVDGQGNPTGRVSETHARLFDPASLHQKLSRYLPAGFEIRSAPHEVNGSRVVVIYVAPHSDGFCVFQTDGHRPNNSFVFRRGDVLARHGTRSERWEQADIAEVRRRLIQREKEAWRREYRRDLEKVTLSMNNQQLAIRAPANALTWKLDAEAFSTTVIEQLRSNDDIPVRLLLESLGREVARLAPADDADEELSATLDRVAMVGALAIRLDRPAWLELAVAGLARGYQEGFGPGAVARYGSGSAILWLRAVERAMVLGGLAVRLGRWAAIRPLTLRPTPGINTELGYPSWIRHTVTVMSNRAANLETDFGLISFAQAAARRQNDFIADLAAEGDERLLTSLCAFDFLAALVVADHVDPRRFQRAVYPSFAQHDAHRTDPIAVQLIQDHAMREAVLPGVDDSALAALLARLSEYAGEEGSRTLSGWWQYHAPAITTFLRKHGAPSPS